MSNDRIGTLTTGILFVALGIGLFLQLFLPFSVVHQFLNWWPILLILIGAEILWSIRSKQADKEEQKRVGYDLFSLFMLVAFACATFFLYTFQELGVLDFAKRTIAIQSFDVQTTPTSVDIPMNVDELVVIGHTRHLKLETTEEDQLTYYSLWRNVSVTDQQEAQKFVEESVSTTIDGHTMYVIVNNPGRLHPFFDKPYGTVSMSIPSHLKVKTEIITGEVDITVHELKNDWHIINDSGYNTWARIHQAGQLNVLARTYHGQIEGADSFWTKMNEEQTKAERHDSDSSYTLRIESKRGTIRVEEEH